MTAKLDQSRLALVLGLSEACIRIRIKPLRFAWPSKATSKTTLKIPSSISNPEKISNDCSTTFIQKSYTRSHIPEILYIVYNLLLSFRKKPPKKGGQTPHHLLIPRSQFCEALVDASHPRWWTKGWRIEILPLGSNIVVLVGGWANAQIGASPICRGENYYFHDLFGRFWKYPPGKKTYIQPGGEDESSEPVTRPSWNGVCQLWVQNKERIW